MEKASVLIIGSEIVEGDRRDGNGQLISRILTQKGLQVTSIKAVPDDEEQILSSITHRLNDQDLIIISGGLGGTHDDITKPALKSLLNADDFFDKEVYSNIERILNKRGVKITEGHRQIAFLPKGATPLPNNIGLCPGVMLEKENTTILALPGVPFEAKHILEHHLEKVIPAKKRTAYEEINLKVAGLRESEISEKLSEVITNLPQSYKISLLPSLSEVAIRITATGENRESLIKGLKALEQDIREVLGAAIYGTGNEQLSSVLGRHLNHRSKNLAVAESCTGGHLAHQITSISGSSQYFKGGVVAYSNNLKQSLLNVSRETLNNHGAVSEPVVKEMVKGATENLGTDCAIATSGIAGPGGGTDEKPVGTIWIAAGDKSHIETQLLQLSYDRMSNIQYTSVASLNLLRLWLSKGSLNKTA